MGYVLKYELVEGLSVELGIECDSWIWTYRLLMGWSGMRRWLGERILNSAIILLNTSSISSWIVQFKISVLNILRCVGMGQTHWKVQGRDR